MYPKWVQLVSPKSRYPKIKHMFFNPKSLHSKNGINVFSPKINKRFQSETSSVWKGETVRRSENEKHFISPKMNNISSDWKWKTLSTDN